MIYPKPYSTYLRGTISLELIGLGYRKWGLGLELEMQAPPSVQGPE